jgi:hypothetical protein
LTVEECPISLCVAELLPVLIETKVLSAGNGHPAYNPPAPPAASNPFAYITPDRIQRIVYRGNDAHIHELRLEGSWIQADLSAIVIDNPPAFPAAGDPFAYVAPDGIPTVIYVGTDQHIHHIRLDPSGWIQADLSAIVTDNPPAFPALNDPFAYITPDGIQRLLYRAGFDFLVLIVSSHFM